MRTTAGTLILAFAVFLNSIDLISSIETTLEDLFPGYNGVLPPIQEVSRERLEQLHHFRRLYGTPLEWQTRRAKFLARGHVIVGWTLAEHIHPLCSFLGSRNSFVVFDTHKEQWNTLNQDELLKLGPKHFLSLVRAREEAAATHIPTSSNPIDIAAHIQARRKANHQLDLIEKEQEKYLGNYETTLENSIRAIKEGYSKAYNRELQRFFAKTWTIQLKPT